MTSFQVGIAPNRRAAARFISKVHRVVKRAYASKPHITQTAIANQLGVHRSVINRQLRGTQDMTIGRLGELAWALGLEAQFDMVEPPQPDERANATDQTAESETPHAYAVPRAPSYITGQTINLGAAPRFFQTTTATDRVQAMLDPV